MKELFMGVVVVLVHYVLACFVVYKFITPEDFGSWSADLRLVYVGTLIIFGLLVFAVDKFRQMSV